MCNLAAGSGAYLRFCQGRKKEFLLNKNGFLPRQPTNRFTRDARRSAILSRLPEKSALMASSVLEEMPFNSCSRGAFSVLGIRTPAILMLLLTLNILAVFSSMKVSISSPFSSTVFPSENMTKI